MRRAFTLVELLVSVGIIAMLVGILLPSLSRARELGRRTSCLANLHSIGVASLSYFNTNKFPPYFDDGITNRGASYSYSWSDLLVKGRHLVTDVNPNKIPNLDGSGGLPGVYLQGMVSNRGKVFQCPEQREHIWTDVAGVPVSYRADYVVTGHEWLTVNGKSQFLPVAGCYRRPHWQDPAIIWMGEAFTNHGGMSSKEYVKETQLHKDANELNPLRHSGGSTYLFADGHAVWSMSYHAVDYNSIDWQQGRLLPWEPPK